MSSGVTAIAAGFTHTCATRASGTRCWGTNARGELGTGTTTAEPLPADVVDLPPLSALALGNTTSCGLTTAGAVRCWGANEWGQLGIDVVRDVVGLTGAPSPHAPFASWDAFVTRQYVDITAKAPSSGALSLWVGQLSSGSKAKGELLDSLRRGSENLADVDPVVRIYRAFLGRAPDAGGLRFWINRRRAVAPARTWTVTQIATDFTGSGEFKAKYGSLTNRQFVTRIYTDVLGRAADPRGVDYWTGKLDTGTRTKAQVVVGFSESNEYRTKQAQNTDVAVAYTFLLGRAPTTGEAADWTTRQKAGTPHTTLLTELLDSAAYEARITG
jgi:hypothetical protein